MEWLNFVGGGLSMLLLWLAYKYDLTQIVGRLRKRRPHYLYEEAKEAEK